MKPVLYLFTILTLAAGSVAQSGRVKPADSPTPRPMDQPRVIYVPTQANSKSPAPRATPPANDDEVVKVASTLVPIPVSVLDTNGRPVSNLRLSDFELKIDGEVVEISELARSETPIRLAMLFDNSSSVLIAREFEKDAAVKFFKRVIRPEKDLAALYSVATTTELEQSFTSEISSLTRAIELFPPPEGATALLEGIIQAADYLREVHGRRVMIIVSDGDDTKSDVTFDETVRALQVANCQVYVVKTTDFENFKRTGSRRGNANIRQLAAERRMGEITGQTGGAVYSPIDESELDDAFRQISAELTQQYVLSYYPDNDTEKRGEFRQITLTLKNRPGFSLRTRKGYYVPKK
ncbi:MAG TPA: VWA domain-containing protein [Pyrinomonadaceae bacterium]|nr:VWA domain-containing protein [Pyrinomonadaceae bacterium]